MQTAYPTPPASPVHSGSESINSHDCPDQIINGRLQIVGELGLGAYGVVYKAIDLLDPARTQYAVKALRKKGLEPRQQKFQNLEIQLHCEASNTCHPNIVRLKDIMEDDEFKYVILEYCPEGDLFSNITDRGRYVREDLRAKQVFLQILDAVMHCHSKEIYHRDLKPENILVTDNGRCVKLADFGLATKDRVTSDFGCGSTFYMSPGTLRKTFTAREYTNK
jgi:serine/threonine protein kinase